MQAREAVRSVVLVAVVAVAAAVLVTATHELSRDRIAANERARLLASLHRVLDPSAHDNDLSRTRFTVTDEELLGTPAPVDVFIATHDGEPVAALLTPVAPDGYNAPIRLLIGIGIDGTVTGVRVLQHRETPGLGDQIEIAKSDWITRFTGTSLGSPPQADWAIRQEGGRFDAFTGATVTPRAVVQAVRDALLYFEQHRDELFDPARRTTDVPAGQ